MLTNLPVPYDLCASVKFNVYLHLLWVNALVQAFPMFVKLRRLIVCSSRTKPSVQWVIRTLKH